MRCTLADEKCIKNGILIPELIASSCDCIIPLRETRSGAGEYCCCVTFTYRVQVILNKICLLIHLLTFLPSLFTDHKLYSTMFGEKLINCCL
jgi:hypothetical protein